MADLTRAERIAAAIAGGFGVLPVRHSSEPGNRVEDTPDGPVVVLGREADDER